MSMKSKSRKGVILDAKIPEGKLEEKWTNHKFHLKLVNPANKRKYDIIVVGTGLAGASAAADPHPGPHQRGPRSEVGGVRP